MFTIEVFRIQSTEMVLPIQLTFRQLLKEIRKNCMLGFLVAQLQKILRSIKNRRYVKKLKVWQIKLG